MRGASDRLDGTVLLLVLRHVVLEGAENFLRLIGRKYYTRYHICLGYAGHELREVKNELRRSMCDECQVGENALLFVRGDVDF